MRVSRAPEKRGNPKMPAIFLSFVAASLTLAAIIVYFTIGFDSTLAMVTQSGESQTSASNLPAIIDPEVNILPTAAPLPEPTPIPAVAITLLEAEAEPAPLPVPLVKFGEVLAEGLVELALPANHLVETWYTFQVDTSTGDITLFFAPYDSLDNIVGTVKVEDYAQGRLLDNAEITLAYPDAPDRVLTFDGPAGTMSLSQEQDWQPYGPSLFSLDLRVALVEQDIKLRDQSGDTTAGLQLDLTGLSNSEWINYQRSEPEVVDRVLLEIQLLVDQIESKRTKR